MVSLAKLVMIGGVVLFVLGAVLWFGAKLFPGGVPGDLAFRRGNVLVYIPIVSSIVLSVVATIVLNIVARWFR